MAPSARAPRGLWGETAEAPQPTASSHPVARTSFGCSPGSRVSHGERECGGGGRKYSGAEDDGEQLWKNKMVRKENGVENVSGCFRFARSDTGSSLRRGTLLLKANDRFGSIDTDVNSRNESPGCTAPTLPLENMAAAPALSVQAPLLRKHDAQEQIA